MLCLLTSGIYKQLVLSRNQSKSGLCSMSQDSWTESTFSICTIYLNFIFSSTMFQDSLTDSLDTFLTCCIPQHLLDGCSVVWKYLSTLLCNVKWNTKTQAKLCGQVNESFMKRLRVLLGPRDYKPNLTPCGWVKVPAMLLFWCFRFSICTDKHIKNSEFYLFLAGVIS